MSKIYLIFENEPWSVPLISELVNLGAAYEMWPMIEGDFELLSTPPEGIYVNRMSASAHTRNHRYSPEYTGCVIRWLEMHNRRVINGGQTLQLEISKAAQYAALSRSGIRIPDTRVVLGEAAFLEAAKRTKTPFIIKHNRAGKGLSVKLINDISEFERFLNSENYSPPVDGLWLIQQYIQSAEAFIMRLEFIDGQFVYAVKVNTQQGFELCPAESCEIEEALCPADTDSGAKFEILPNFNHPLIDKYEHFLKTHKIDVAAFEFICDKNNIAYTYDINTNTNYNAEAENKVGIYAMRRLAMFLTKELGLIL